MRLPPGAASERRRRRRHPGHGWPPGAPVDGRSERRLHDPCHTSVPPTSLPALGPPDRPSRPSSMPRVRSTGRSRRAPARASTQSVGVVPDAPEYAIDLVCLGPGEMAVFARPAGADRLRMSSTIVCDGKPQSEFFQNGGGVKGQHEVFLTTDSRTAWHARIGVVGAAPSASPTSRTSGSRRPSGGRTRPSLSARSGRRWTTPDSLEVTRFDPATSPPSHRHDPGVGRAGRQVDLDGRETGRQRRPAGSRSRSVPARPTDKESAIVFVDLLDPTAPPNPLWVPSRAHGMATTRSRPPATDASRSTIRRRELLEMRRSPILRSRSRRPRTEASIRSGRRRPMADSWRRAPRARRPGTAAEWGVHQRRRLIQCDDGPPAGLSTDRAASDSPERTPIASRLHGSGHDSSKQAAPWSRQTPTGKPIATRVGTPDYAVPGGLRLGRQRSRRVAALRRRRGGGSGATGDGMRIALPLATGWQPAGIRQAPTRRRGLRHPGCQSDGRRSTDRRHRFAEQLAPRIRRSARRPAQRRFPGF